MRKMKHKIIYINGYTKDKNEVSKKYNLIKEFIPELELLAWDCNDDLESLVNNFQIDEDTNYVLIGSSTGGNLAIRIYNRGKELEKHIKLILINPLINNLKLTNIIDDKTFSYIDDLDVSKVIHSLFLISKQDEVIDHSKHVGVSPFNGFLFFDDGHSANKMIQDKDIQEKMLYYINLYK